MPRRRYFIVPCVLVAAFFVYALAVPSHRSAGQAPSPTSSVEATSTPSPTTTTTATTTATTPVADQASAMPPALLHRLTGRLTYRTGREQVIVGFPAATAIERQPMPPIDSASPSADGLWSVATDCNDAGCRVRLRGTDGSQRVVDVPFVSALQWSPEGHQLAMTTSGSGGHPTSYRLTLIDDPAIGQPRTVYETRSSNAHPFAWLSSGDLLIVDNSDSDARVVRVTTSGAATTIATVPSTVWYLYASSDRKTFAFTQNSPLGWQLWTVDGGIGSVRDVGNMGSDPAGIIPPAENPPIPEKGPMYIAWSPDGSKLAFGGGYEPPYTMTIVDVASGTKQRTEFADGYPGEIKWSPDGTKLAVSTYNLLRTNHESYVVDPETGIARHVVSGCVIVWSPDSRFLAIHGEREPGIAIADVETLNHVQLTHTSGDTPLSWER